MHIFIIRFLNSFQVPVHHPTKSFSIFFITSTLSYPNFQERENESGSERNRKVSCRFFANPSPRVSASLQISHHPIALGCPLPPPPGVWTACFFGVTDWFSARKAPPPPRGRGGWPELGGLGRNWAQSPAQKAPKYLYFFLLFREGNVKGNPKSPPPQEGSDWPTKRVLKILCFQLPIFSNFLKF